MPPTAIEIPMPTPSLNQLRKMHFHAVKRLRDRYTVILRTHATALNRAGPYQFRRVIIERRGVRALDYDNLVGGCKPLVDALCRAGLLWDDAPKHCQIQYTQTKVPAKSARTVVVVM
jgi:hypothetical protein